MAKRKDSIALFEVIKNRRSDANLNVPQWMGAKGAVGAGEPPPPPPPPPAQPAAPGAASKAWSRLASGAGGQLTLKLSYAHLLLAAAVLALVVVVSVWLGSRFGSPAVPARPAPNLPLTDRVPPGQYVVAGKAGTDSGAKAPPVAPASTAARVSGKYYLVIQSLVGATKEDQVEAEQIRAWCAQHGEPATVATHTLARTGKSRCIVWSLRAFDSPNSPEALNYGRKIEALGRDYKAQYKRYDFRQQRDGKFDPWFEVYRAQPAKK